MTVYDDCSIREGPVSLPISRTLDARRQPRLRDADTPPMDQEPHRDSPLRSLYEDDPDLRDLVVMFVDELDRRVDSIRSAFDASDLAELRTISHQLKGAAGGYGFDPIGDAAGRLEYDLIGDEADMSHLSERVEDLILLCRAAVGPRD